MEYQTQQIGGATITVLVDPNAPPPGPFIPQSVTAFQAKAALLQSGLLDDVESIMAMPETPRIVTLAWNEALYFERQSPTVSMLAGALGLTSGSIDDLFVAASQITA
jgi:hypothetical protein